MQLWLCVCVCVCVCVSYANVLQRTVNGRISRSDNDMYICMYVASVDYLLHIIRELTVATVHDTYACSKWA